MSRAAELASELERAAGELADYAAGLTAEEWRRSAANHPEIVVGEDENRPVGVVVRHVAEWYPRLVERMLVRASGRVPPPFDRVPAASARG